MEVADIIETRNSTGFPIATVDFTVVGRRPEDIKQITLEYDGHTVILDPGPDKFANLSPIILYAEGRDFWTNALRQKALTSD